MDDEVRRIACLPALDGANPNRAGRRSTSDPLIDGGARGAQYGALRPLNIG